MGLEKIGDIIPAVEKGLELPRAAVPPTSEEWVYAYPTHDEMCLARQKSWNIPPAHRGALVRDFTEADFDPRCDAGWILGEPIGKARSVFICGPNGVGKSHLAAALQGEWGGNWQTATEIMLRVTATWRRGSDESEAAVVTDLQTRRLLVIDDITAIEKSERGLSVILAILGGRIDRKLATIATSFQGLGAIDLVDSSLASRLGGFEQVVLVGRDRRLRRGGTQ